MPVSILGLCGSLRAKSYNRALLRAADELKPDDMRIQVFDIAPLPLYDADQDGPEPPAPVAALKAAIRAADGLLFATPEYNYSVPGVLKNAIDWASRVTPGETRGCMVNKPAGIIGCSPGPSGTARGQAHLRQAFLFTQTYALLSGEFTLAHCADKFDAELRLVDAKSREFLGKYLVRLRDWTLRLRGM